MKLYFFRRLKSFFVHHWIKFFIAFFVVLILGLCIWGLASLESFYRKQMMATIPVQVFIGMLHALIFAYIIINMQGRGFTSMRRAIIKPEMVNMKFDDVIGIDEAKMEAKEVVELIKDHKRLDQVGGKIIRGILMIGPPGCGKTLLAKAIASEANIPFISMAGSEFVEVFVGVGASRVRKLFKNARQMAYDNGACIVFIDELDVIGRGRSFSMFGGGGETNSTQNQLLVEMDGLGSRKENIIVIGATNAQENVLDEALLRPGRFDRKIYVGRPYEEGREKLFEFYLNKVKHDPNINIERWARRSVHKSPAEIENIVKEAALIATRKGNSIVYQNDMSQAMERIELGIKHHRKVADVELVGTAYHEAGHLIATFFLHPTDDIFKASIATRKGTLGVVYRQAREEILSPDKEKLIGDIKCSLGGYLAEKAKFGSTTTGVSSDFRFAMNQAYCMVWDYGMSLNNDRIRLGNYQMVKETLSDSMKEELNREVEKIIEACAKEVELLFKKEIELLDRFAMELLKREELDYDEIEEIFREHGKSDKDRARNTHKDKVFKSIIDERNKFLEAKVKEEMAKNAQAQANGSLPGAPSTGTAVADDTGSAKLITPDPRSLFFNI
ncbi:MAG: AAA family ATPase [Candidatus Auribacterota bacterium]